MEVPLVSLVYDSILVSRSSECQSSHNVSSSATMVEVAVMVVTFVLQIAPPLVSYCFCSAKHLFSSMHAAAKLFAHRPWELTRNAIMEVC
jgi:hypothetical protein